VCVRLSLECPGAGGPESWFLPEEEARELLFVGFYDKISDFTLIKGILGLLLVK
jgi:hypothetical protein